MKRHPIHKKLDRLIDHCPEFAKALDDYQLVQATGNAEAAAKAWQRCTDAAQAFWAKQKREEAA